MGLVTVTDHDSIDAAEALRKHPDFFLSEEVTVRMPTGTQVHLGVYDIRERDHLEIQRRRNDFISLVMYLSERKLFFSVNHVFSGLTGRRDERDFDWFASYAPAMEVRNGQMCASANSRAAELATRFGKVPLAGSDSHTLAGLGLTHTEVPGEANPRRILFRTAAGPRPHSRRAWGLRQAHRRRFQRCEFAGSR
jgi:predicted metal-dependent phosphoesterase TrpH